MEGVFLRQVVCYGTTQKQFLYPFLANLTANFPQGREEIVWGLRESLEEVLTGLQGDARHVLG